jgi:hypothetical protein
VKLGKAKQKQRERKGPELVRLSYPKNREHCKGSSSARIATGRDDQ